MFLVKAAFGLGTVGRFCNFSVPAGAIDRTNPGPNTRQKSQMEVLRWTDISNDCFGSEFVH